MLFVRCIRIIIIHFAIENVVYKLYLYHLNTKLLSCLKWRRTEWAERGRPTIFTVILSIQWILCTVVRMHKGTSDTT